MPVATGARHPVAALAMGALVETKAQFGRAAGGQQTEHPPDPCTQVELGKHRGGKSPEDAAHRVEETRAILCLRAEPVHSKAVVWGRSLVAAGRSQAAQINQIQR